MIVRTTHKRDEDTDYGPCPGGVDGLGSANAMALRSEVFVAPVERRYLTPVELAVIRQSDPEPVKRVHVDRGVEYMREAGRRGAAATKAKRTPPPAPTRHSDDVVWAAIRAAGGNLTAAAKALGQDRGTFRQRVKRRRAAGLVPWDVREMIQPQGSGYWTLGRHVTADTRALMSIRRREYLARRNAA